MMQHILLDARTKLCGTQRRNLAVRRQTTFLASAKQHLFFKEDASSSCCTMSNVMVVKKCNEGTRQWAVWAQYKIVLWHMPADTEKNNEKLCYSPN
jgi:hypothetical protein